MIDKKEIESLFLEKNGIEIAPYIDKVVKLYTYPISNPDIEEVFVGGIRYNDNFPMLDVGFPWREGEKTSFARSSAVSPNIEEPKAYYILKRIEDVSDEVVEKWVTAGRKFIKTIKAEK